MTLTPALDLFPLAAAVLATLTCALLGNFLVLRRLSLMGDAISHSVLPGLVIAFLVASVRSPLPVLLGAAIAGIVTVGLVELVKRLTRVEPGAAMGVVFTLLFALGVLLIESAAARHVDLDADCVLHGQLELLAWFDAPASWRDVWNVDTLRAVPRQVVVLGVAFVAAGAFVGLLYKELRLAAFDPALATAQGFSATLLHYLLMILVALATVAAFEAVGSILVIAMLVCPAAAARLLTDRLAPQIGVSLLAALASGVLGYIGASAVPAALGADAVNAAGSITIVSGGVLLLAILASPRHGVLVRLLRRRALAREIALDDLLAALFRARELDRRPVSPGTLASVVPGVRLDALLSGASRLGLVHVRPEGVGLTPAGEARAADVVRRHRLWECYLVDEAGLSPDHVHPTAEALEHTPLRPEGAGRLDPHGRPIPGAPGAGNNEP